MTDKETFYERLDRVERENRIKRLFENRPANLHDYQGCAKDAAKEKVLKVYQNAQMQCSEYSGQYAISLGDWHPWDGTDYFDYVSEWRETEEAAWQNAAESLPAQPEQNMRLSEETTCKHCEKVIWRCTDEVGLKFGWKHKHASSSFYCEYPKTHAEPVASLPTVEEASDEYIRGFNKCKEMAQRVVFGASDLYEHIGYLDPVASFVSPTSPAKAKSVEGAKKKKSYPDNYSEAADFAGITLSQACQFDLYMQYLLGRGLAPASLPSRMFVGGVAEAKPSPVLDESPQSIKCPSSKTPDTEAAFEEWWGTEPVSGIWRSNSQAKMIGHAAWRAAIKKAETICAK